MGEMEMQERKRQQTAKMIVDMARLWKNTAASVHKIRHLEAK